jgi:thiol:disulfide interchange protein DsbD
VDLITDPTRSAGGRFWVGVRFRLDEHWHLYWQNPGDSGAAPVAEWKTAPHVKVGPFEWPAPERIDVSGLVNYGYHGTVVLPAQAVVAADAGAPGRVSVALRWLVCRDMCVPGRATLSVDVGTPGVNPPEMAAWRAAIAAARASVPQKAPSTWMATATATGRTFELVVRTGHPASSAVFFPHHPSQVDDAAPQVAAPMGDGIRLTLRQSAQIAGIPDTLSGVIRIQGHSPVVISAPVTR